MREQERTTLVASPLVFDSGSPIVTSNSAYFEQKIKITDALKRVESKKAWDKLAISF